MRVLAALAHPNDRKIQALRCYVSERREPPHPHSVDAVLMRSIMSGGVAGVAHAEAFVLLREVLR